MSNVITRKKPMTEAPVDLTGIRLMWGSHDGFDERNACLMEVVAYAAGEAHTDRPHCVSPVVGIFGRLWNDGMLDADRQMLLCLVPAMIGTQSGDEDDETRAFMVADWLARTCVPAWFISANLPDRAVAITALPPIIDGRSAMTATAVIVEMYQGVQAAINIQEEYKPHSVCADDAANYAADSAMNSAGLSAAESATRVGFTCCHRSAVAHTAYVACLYAVRAVARHAAYAAVYPNARTAATEGLRPTVEVLQASALDLLRRMCAVGRSPAEGIR